MVARKRYFPIIGELPDGTRQEFVDSESLPKNTMITVIAYNLYDADATEKPSYKTIDYWWQPIVRFFFKAL